MGDKYRRDGTPYPEGKEGFEEWCRDYEKPRHVALDTLKNGLRVSTVWLGLDYNFLPTGRPLIFETMVFGPANYRDLDCERYATEEEAVEGHRKMCRKWENREVPDRAKEEPTPEWPSFLKKAREIIDGEKSS